MKMEMLVFWYKHEKFCIPLKSLQQFERRLAYDCISIVELEIILATVPFFKGFIQFLVGNHFYFVYLHLIVILFIILFLQNLLYLVDIPLFRLEHSTYIE